VKKTVFCLLPFVLMASNINIPTNVNNHTIKKAEQGWRFGDNPEVNTTKALDDKKTIKQILAEMLKVQKEQLKAQKKILSILEDRFDPKPEVITLPNGKKCVANSSAECFKMPLTPVAKRIPVLKNWLINRDEKSAAAYIKWQSKYLQKISKAAYAYDFAVTEFGNKVAQLDYSRPGFEETFGKAEVIKSNYKKMLIDEYRNKYKLYFFLGLNSDLDVYSFTSIARFVNKHPKLKYTVVFKDDKEKKAFVDAANIFSEIKNMIKNKNVQLVVMPDIFKKLNIYTTPTISIKLNNSNTINKIMIGRLNSVLPQKIINFLKYKGIIKEGDNPAFKAWQKAGNYSKQYYQHYYDTDVNSIIKTYKGEK
jgi:hypothetical protein